MRARPFSLATGRLSIVVVRPSCSRRNTLGCTRLPRATCAIRSRSGTELADSSQSPMAFPRPHARRWPVCCPSATIQQNRLSIEPQVRRFLVDAGQNAMVVDNAEWLAPLNYLGFLRDIGRHFSVNRMLAAEAYRQRMEKGLSFIEFTYQILQAYDYLVLYRKY